jgi:glycosyltransferase involved in cell wall biosynthesis
MVRTLAAGLAQNGVETHVATTDDNDRSRLTVIYGEPVIDEKVYYWHFRRQSKFYIFSWPLTVWLAKNVRHYDLVHIHALFSYAASPAAFWAKRCGVPYLVRPLGTLNRWGMTNRRPTLKKLSLRWIESRILEGAARIHYTSEEERLEAAEVNIQGPSVILPNPLPEPASFAPAGEFRKRYPQSQGRQIVLFLSRFDRKKGLDLLLDAFARVVVGLPDALLVLAGEGDPPFMAELQSQARQLGIASHILWAGFLAGKDKSAAFADADLFVLPSYSENFGIAVIEAMAAGLPVIVSDAVAVHKQVAKAGAGLVTSCNADILSEAIQQLLRDADLRQDMAKRGEFLSRDYSASNVARQLIEVYDDILGENGGYPASMGEPEALADSTR